MHLVVWLPQVAAADVPALCHRASEVGVDPLVGSSLSAPARAGLMPGLASLDEEQILEGVRRLSGAIQAFVPQRR